MILEGRMLIKAMNLIKVVDSRGPEMAVSAVMTVDAEGRPVNWRTEDRYAEVKGRNLKDRWSTPFEGTEELAGLRIPEKGAGIHDYDGTPYVYVELDRVHDLVLDARGLPDRP